VRWADLEAQEMLRDKGNDNDVTPRPFGSAIERRRWLRESVYWRAPMFVRCFAYWFYRYFVRLGFLDGKEGLIFHFLQGLWFRLLIDAKLLELRRAHSPQQARKAIPDLLGWRSQQPVADKPV